MSVPQAPGEVPPPSPLPPPDLPTASDVVNEFVTLVKQNVASLTLTVKEYVPSTSDSVVAHWIVTGVCVVITLVVVVLFVALGWFLVWRCYLSRFKFVRELLLGSSQTPPTSTPEHVPSPPPAKKPRPKRQMLDN